MTYVDGQYISIARKNEMEHHEHTMDKLRAQVAQLNKAVAWESEQHQARLNELQQVEDTLSVDKRPIPNAVPAVETIPSQLESTLSITQALSPDMETELTVEPAKPVKRRKTKARKNVHLSTQESVPELVG